MRRARARRVTIATISAAVIATGVSTLTVAGAGTEDAARPAAPAKAAVAGVPNDPIEVFHEDFEAMGGTAPIALNNYTGAAPLSPTYTAAATWLPGGGSCNGIVLANSTTTPGAIPCNYYAPIKALANTLGTVNGSANPANNHVVAAYTAGNPGPDAIEFETVNAIPLPGSGSRFVTFSVNAAAINCNSQSGNLGEPLYKFYLIDPANPATEIPTFSSPINPCGSAGSGSGQFFSNGSTLFSGSSLKVRLRNGYASGGGNDAAFDDIRVFDATPALDKAFVPATVAPGAVSKLVFTVTNTTDLAAKNGWSFTEMLPSGVVVAPTPNATTTCPSGVVTPALDNLSIAYSGNLAAGNANKSCTLSVDVVAANPGTYTNTAANVTNRVGLNPPPDAVLVADPDPSWDCTTSQTWLMQGGPTQLNTVVYVPGSAAFTPVGTATRHYNALGFNPDDNFLYAITTSADALPNQLVRIDQSGTVANLGATGLPSDYNSGTFDPSGNYYFADDNSTGVRVMADLTDPTTTTVLDLPGTNVVNTGDFAWFHNAIWGGQYPAAANGALRRITPATATTATDLTIPVTGLPGGANAVYGGAWVLGNGNLALINNITGTIYQIAVVNPESTDPMSPPTASVVATAPSAPVTLNDAASCIGQPADLSIIKTASPSPAATGAAVTYTLTVTNNGPGNSTGFTVTDSAPAAFDLDTTPTTTPGCAFSGQDLTCTEGPLGAGQSFVITYTGTAPDDPGTLINTATVLGNDEDPTPDNDTTTKITVVGTPIACPTSRIFLSQGSPTQLNVLTPGTGTFTTVGPTATPNYNGIAFNPNDGFIYGVNADGDIVRIDDTGEAAVVGAATPPLTGVTFNNGAIGPDGFLYLRSNNSNLRRIDLTSPTLTNTLITLTGSAPTSDLTFIGNDLWGEDNAQDRFVRITLNNLANPTTGVIDTFAPAPFPVPSSESGAVWTYGNGNLGLSDNVSGKVYQVRITNPTAVTPTFSLVGAPQTGPASAQNDGTICLGAPADLKITKTAVPQPVAANAPITYTLTVQNLGGGDSSGYIVTDTAPAGLTNLTAVTAGCSFAGNALTCLGGPLASGASKQFVYTGVAPNSATPLDNSATVTGNEEDPEPGNNTSTTSTPIIPLPTPTPPAPPAPPKGPDLAIVITGPKKITPGGNVPLTIKVKNKGPGKSTGEIVKYTLPKGINSAKVTYPKGVKCAFSGRQLICNLGSVPAGKSLTIKVTGKVASNAKGTIHTGTRVSGKNDTNKKNNKSAIDMQVVRPQARPVTRPAPTDPCAAAASRGYAAGMPGGDC